MRTMTTAATIASTATLIPSTSAKPAPTAHPFRF